MTVTDRPTVACEARTLHPKRVESVRAALPSARTTETMAALFALLGDPNRLRLLLCLAEADELCVCDLAAAAGMLESTTSHALRLLKAHQLVRARRSGRSVYYSLDDKHVADLLTDVRTHSAHSGGTA